MDGWFVDGINIVALIAVLGLFFIMLRYRKPPGPVRPARDLAYEWVAERADRAKPEFRAKFDDGTPGGPRIVLVRIAFFNGGTEPIEPGETIKPLAVLFQEGAEVVYAAFAEALKSPGTGAPQPTIGPARIDLPPFAIAPAGVVVFNIAIRGDKRPIELEGAIEGIDTIRRLG